MAAGDLRTWRDTGSRRAIVDFVERVTTAGGPDFVPPAERIAVFDNDGTLWCEKPIPIELGFLLRRFAEMAEQDEALRTRQPWQAAHERDLEWLGGAMTKHYHGDDTDMKTLMGAILEAFEDHTVERYCAAAESYLRGGAHPTLPRGLLQCAYAPMIDLLDYLAANGFSNYIASGGDRDFMRPITEAVYGIPSERVIGSSNALRWTDDEDGGTVRYQAAPDYFDDGPVKPVRIWSRIGRPHCGCSSSTTTTSASSPTPAGRSRRSTAPPRTAGRWRVSRTTGRRCSPNPPMVPLRRSGSKELGHHTGSPGATPPARAAPP
jgi:phosphoglycolate phosphatase-like HAD superfamily hydrolase